MAEAFSVSLQSWVSGLGLDRVPIGSALALAWTRRLTSPFPARALASYLRVPLQLVLRAPPPSSSLGARPPNYAVVRPQGPIKVSGANRILTGRATLTLRLQA